MNSKDAEIIITSQMSRIKKFALSKEKNIHNAEEIASRIIEVLYISLLKVDSINNIDNYVNKISRNVYAQFVNEERKIKQLYHDYQTHLSLLNDLEPRNNEEIYFRLIKEISFLEKTYRDILQMRFFDKMTLEEIAEKLQVSVRHVRWQLSVALKKLKEVMLKPFRDNKDAEKVKFTGAGQEGTCGNKGQHIGTYFKNTLAQHIAYSAYYQPKTVSEIARELCTEAFKIEKLIKKLEKNSYIEKVTSDKYLTKFLIFVSSIESLNQKNQVYNEYAKYICDLYIPKLFNVMKKHNLNNIYIPNNDFNFLMWSIVSYACKFKLSLESRSTFLKEYHVKRADGSENFVFAWLEKELDWQNLEYVKKLYDVLEDANNYSTEQKISWQFNTYYDTRQAEWEDYEGIDFDNLHDHILGIITNNTEHLEKYSRLYKKHYLVKTKQKEYVNTIVVSKTENDLLNILPNIPTKLKIISKNLDKEMYEIDKKLLPKHMHEICKAWNTDILASSEIRIRVLEQLLNSGFLKPLSEVQKATVNMIMFSDVLPS